MSNALSFRQAKTAPQEVHRAENFFAKVLQQGTGDHTWINRYADYDRLLDALTAAKAPAGVKNTATAFGLLLDLAEKHLAELGGEGTYPSPHR